MKVFADQLREKMVALGISQAEMATKIGVAPGTLSAYLNDRKCPSLDKAAQIAEVLGVTVGQLCGEETDENDTSVLKGGKVSYARVIRIISELTDVGVLPPDIWMHLQNNVLRSFVERAIPVHKLFSNGIIDQELYDAWIEKQMRGLDEREFCAKKE